MQMMACLESQNGDNTLSASFQELGLGGNEGCTEEGPRKLSPDEMAKRCQWKREINVEDNIIGMSFGVGGGSLTPRQKLGRSLGTREQEELKSQLVEIDSDDVKTWRKGANPFANLQHVAGVDISFDKEHPTHACAMLAILSFPDLKVVHVSWAIVEMTEPYIPGFLAFREVGFLLQRLEVVKHDCPHLMPQVILVDGNGVLHPRGFGLASHLGVLSSIPCVGVGKKLYHVDGLEKSSQHKEKVNSALHRKGDCFPLKGSSGRIWGMAVRTSDDASNPVYVSVGHKVSLETATQLVITCSKKRVPEPVRQADLLSREHLRQEKKHKQ